jgi:hypothetical protein
MDTVVVVGNYVWEEAIWNDLFLTTPTVVNSRSFLEHTAKDKL